MEKYETSLTSREKFSDVTLVNISDVTLMNIKCYFLFVMWRFIVSFLKINPYTFPVMSRDIMWQWNVTYQIVSNMMFSSRFETCHLQDWIHLNFLTSFFNLWRRKWVSTHVILMTRDVRYVYKRSITDVTRAVCDVTNLSLGSFQWYKFFLWNLL